MVVRVICCGDIGSNREIGRGLSETSASLKLGGCGSGSPSSSPAWRGAGFASLDDFKRGFLEAYFLPMDPNNLLCQSWKWRNADVSRHTNGDLAQALGRVTARTIVAAISTDMFFPLEDCRQDAAMIPGAELRVIDSLWGHMAGFCVLKEDADAIDAILRDVLALDAA